jgi:hypothetical protein
MAFFEGVLDCFFSERLLFVKEGCARGVGGASRVIELCLRRVVWFAWMVIALMLIDAEN